MDKNEAILEKLRSAIPELQIDTLNLESELNETLKGAKIELSEENFDSFKYYMSEHKDIFDLYIFLLA